MACPCQHLDVCVNKKVQPIQLDLDFELLSDRFAQETKLLVTKKIADLAVEVTEANKLISPATTKSSKEHSTFQPILGAASDIVGPYDL